MKAAFIFRKIFPVFLVLCSMLAQGQMNLAASAFVFALYGHEAIDYGRSKVNQMLDEIVAQEINRSYEHSSTFLSAGFDAFTDYQGGYGGSEALRDQGPSYASATQSMIQTYKDNFLGGMNFIPPHAYCDVCLAHHGCLS